MFVWICADFSPDSDQSTLSLEEALWTHILVQKCWISFLQTRMFCLLKILPEIIIRFMTQYIIHTEYTLCGE